MLQTHTAIKLMTMQNYDQQTEVPKLRIATTITEIKSVDKEITLPYYFQDKDRNICKVVSNDHLISIDTDKDWWGTKVFPVRHYKAEISQGTPISEFEFEAAYQKAMMYVDLICKNQEVSKEVDENVEIDEMRENRIAS